MLTHDSIQWYGIFQYFAESIYNGSWPLWNPYTHAGEPFYYNYNQMHLLEPVGLVCILIGKLLHVDILTIYHWSFVLKILFMCLGTYLLLRRFYKHFFTRGVIFIVILFSSHTIICMRLLGLVEVFYWTPWVLFALFRIFADKRSVFSWILFATFLGLSFCSYGVVYLLSFLFILLGSFLIINRTYFNYFRAIFHKDNLKVISIVILILILLSSPLWSSVLLDMNKISPVGRTIDGITKGVFLSIEDMNEIERFWSSAVNSYDLFGLIYPFNHYDFLRAMKQGYKTSNVLTESLLYIGIFPLICAIYGMLFAKDKYKWNFMILLISIGLLMLGTKFIFYIIFSYLFPVIRFSRHPMQFLPFFLLTLYYFSGQGIDLMIDKYEQIRLKKQNNGILLTFMSNELLLIILIISLVLVTVMSSIKVSQSTRTSVYFYFLCLMFLILFRRYFGVGRYGKIILATMIITDLFIFNCFYRPLMYSKRNVPFSTAAMMPELPVRRGFDIGIKSPIIRLKSLLFRKQAIERNYSCDQSSFFELNRFSSLMSIPVNNIMVICGVTEPIIKFHKKAIDYRDEYFDKYFKDAEKEDVLRRTLFIHGAEGIDKEVLYKSDQVNTEIDDNLFHYNVLKYMPNELTLRVYTANRGFLYFSDGYDNYWETYVDGKISQLWRANINFKAVLIEPGAHIVEFNYVPTYHILSLILHFVTIVSIIIYICIYIIHKYNKHRGSE